MADDFIFIESFGKYVKKHNVTYETWAGSPNLCSGNVPYVSMDQGFLKEYLNVDSANMSVLDVITGPGSVPFALYMVSFGGSCAVRKSLPANYSRVLVGCGMKCSLVGGTTQNVLAISDATTHQLSLYITSGGTLKLDRGNVGGTNLFTSAAVFLAGVRHYVELDATIHPSTGAYQILVDGVSITSATGQNTRNTANSYVNGYYLGLPGASGVACTWDSFYIRDNTTGTATALGDRVVDGLPIVGPDSSVQFTPSATVVGPWYMMMATTGGNAPGAGQIALVPITPDANCTINSIGIMPRATSASAKFKAVIYADAAGVPTGAPLSDGTEVTGCTSGTPLTLALVTPQAIVAGTQYWAGYYTDTSVAIQVSDLNSTVGIRKANTYASGAPNPVGVGFTTGQNPWSIWGNATSSAANFPQAKLDGIPLVAGVPVAYNQDSTVGHVDRFDVTDLTVTPTVINTVQVSVAAQRSDAGTRTMNIRGRSGSTSGNGDNAGITPATTMQFYHTRLKVNPATAAAWTPAEINSMKAEIEVAS